MIIWRLMVVAIIIGCLLCTGTPLGVIYIVPLCVMTMFGLLLELVSDVRQIRKVLVNNPEQKEKQIQKGDME
ncbi:MAG: hypothetical protein Q4D62_08775 [Planctomycetia bacterium]|nr:hypothetical protein [Planctomycetia bacterium]